MAKTNWTCFVLLIFITSSSANLLTPNCGGNLSASFYEIELTSPGYPGNHRHNLYCRWLIYPTLVGRSIKLTLTDLDTEPCCDYVQVYGGNQLLGQYTGSITRNIPIVTTYSYMSVVFMSDSSISQTGFRATYMEVNNCGQRLNATSTPGGFSTPFYPDPHPPYLDCFWIIFAPTKTQQVQVTIESGRTESCCDYIEVFSEQKSFGRLKGNISRQVFTAESQLSVYFHSNGKIALDGFKASYELYVCGRNYDLKTDAVQTITSPFYPNKTRHNLDCVYNFETDPAYIIELTITVDTEPCCDYVQLYEGNRHVARLKGKVPRSNFITSGRHLRLVYHTDSSVESLGFKATFKRLLPRCGNTTVATQITKQLLSPGYPAGYPASYRCDWVIHTRSGSQILLSVLDFLTETCCDSVEIFDGMVSIGKLRGKIQKDLSLVTQTNMLRIQFNSDDSNEKRGFHFSYTQVDNCGDSIQSSSKILSLGTPYYPQDYRDNMNCMWVIQADVGQQISLNITAGETERYHDYIQILDGLNPIAKLSGALTPQNFISTKNILRLYFHSDSSSTRDGFIANFEQLCKKVMNVTSQPKFLSSPSYPNHTPHNYKCNYYLNASPGQRILLTVINFSTEHCCDYVQIFEGERVVRLLNGDVALNTIIYSGAHQMRLLYVTDGTHVSRGFRFTYQLAPM